MTQLQEMLPKLKGDVMNEYEDEFMMSLITQLKYLHTRDAATDIQVSKLYRTILTVIDSVSIFLY